MINRVFDSSGPEGKVRGTPQQIIEKYQMLARDAQLSGDRVAAENFQQHSEHYTRLLGEAMREQNERRDAHEAQQAQQNQNQPNISQNNQNQPSHTQPNQPQPSQPQPNQRRPQPREDQDQPGVASYEDEQPGGSMVPVRELQMATDSGLVETPENNAKPAPVKKRPRRVSKPAVEASAEASADSNASE